MDDVDHVDFAYWKGGPKSGWTTNWSNGELPGLIRISIAFRRGDGRHWPDLLAAPIRIRPEQ